MNASTPYSVPHTQGRWRAVALAVVVHAALFAFLWFGIRWQNEKPQSVEAEIWSPNTQEAAPLPMQKIPKPQPELPQIKPAEKVQEKPVPEPVPEPRHIVATPPVAKPDIALEQEKKRKARQEELKQAQELEQERLEKKQHEKELLKEKLAQKEKEKEKELKQAQKEKDAAQKQAEKEKEKALAQKKHAEDEASKIAAAAQDKKHKQELAKKAALATAAEDAKLAKLREAEMHRMTGGASSAGATGSGGNGSAAKSQGSRGDPGYGDRIKGKIKSNTIFNVPNDLNGNPAAVYEINLLPDGTIRGLRLKKSSGVPGFDEAVKRGIEKSEPFPKDKSGEVPPNLELTYKPKD